MWHHKKLLNDVNCGSMLVARHIRAILQPVERRKSVQELFSLKHVLLKSRTGGMMLPNWLTYKMREQVMDFERKAYHSLKAASISLFKTTFNMGP